MDLTLDYTNKKIKNTQIIISGSKSESNRLLILQQWYPNLLLKNLSDSDDTQHLQEAIQAKKELIDISHAGTAMRFLTAYFSTIEGSEIILTGSERMKNRPVKVLVNAMRDLGAEITYIEKEGYPPLRIIGKQLTVSKVAVNGNISSQYISALLLLAPSLKQGLEVELLNEVTSRPYLEMTLNLLEQLGIQTLWKRNIIQIFPKATIENTTITVESDWSSASYFYSLVALSELGTRLTLSAYKKDSLQGDSCLVAIYKAFGVETEFIENGIKLVKINSIFSPSSALRVDGKKSLDLRNAPDIAQTIAVTCFGLGISCNLTGLHTLKIKETDRLVALQNELQKLGAEIEITKESLHLKATTTINQNCTIRTYNDHRMAMAFAPLALKIPIIIKNADVVTKSYRNFWKDLESCFAL